jgi:VIT1/CCC1 family predicted Fe2+/Mn2+ transporter
MVKDEGNRNVIEEIIKDETRHYESLKSLTGQELSSNKFLIWYHYLLIRIFGLTFGIKLLERNEVQAQTNYSLLRDDFDEIAIIEKEEEEHEHRLFDMFHEEKLRYIGSIVLGLNDALVELTGALAGFTFAFQNTKLIALTGLITGISASLSMAASEYLASIHNNEESEAKISALYTGIAYVITVLLLVIPFLIFKNPFLCLGITLGTAVLIIFIFNYYVSVAKDLNFRKRFLEMVSISLGVSVISFIIGIIMKSFFNIEL